MDRDRLESCKAKYVVFTETFTVAYSTIKPWPNGLASRPQVICCYKNALTNDTRGIYGLL